MQGHARRTHVQECRDHVNRAKDRGRTRYVNSENSKIHRHPLFGCGKRWVQDPSNARAKLPVATRRQHRGDAQRRTSDIEPEGQIVHPWERHVRRADLQGHKVVTEAAEKGRNNHKEHHQDAMVRDHNVPQVSVWRTFRSCVCDETRSFEAHVLHAGVHQLQAHVDSKGYRNEADKAGDEKV